MYISIGMELEERISWAIGIIEVRGGQATKERLIGLAMAKGLSHTAAYDLVRILVAKELVREITKDGIKILILLREAVSP